jgi:hypothetical protein
VNLSLCVCVCVCVSLCSSFRPSVLGVLPNRHNMDQHGSPKKGTPGGRTEAGSRQNAWRSGPVEQERTGNGSSLLQKLQALVRYAGKILKRICSMDWRCIGYSRRGVNGSLILHKQLIKCRQDNFRYHCCLNALKPRDHIHTVYDLRLHMHRLFSAITTTWHSYVVPYEWLCGFKVTTEYQFLG